MSFTQQTNASSTQSSSVLKCAKEGCIERALIDEKIKTNKPLCGKCNEERKKNARTLKCKLCGKEGVCNIPTIKAQNFKCFDCITKSKVVEVQVIEPKLVEVQVIEPKVVEVQVIEPKVVEVQVIEPKVVEVQVIEPKLTKVKCSGKDCVKMVSTKGLTVKDEFVKCSDCLTKSRVECSVDGCKKTIPIDKVKGKVEHAKCFPCLNASKVKCSVEGCKTMVVNGGNFKNIKCPNHRTPKK
jgi:hypothetical protein